MYKIVQAPSEILRTPAKPVDLKMPGLEKIIIEMKKILVNQKDPEGVGLAANQIGLPYRLFLARFSGRKHELIRVFINPEILEHSKEFQIEKKKSPLEGCLSLPKYYGVVKRWKWIKLKYFNEQLAMCNQRFDSFPAVVIQHEMDHLDGKIFVERILEQQGSLYRITGKNNKNKDIWEEVEI